MRFVGVKSAPDISFKKFRRAASYLNLNPDATERDLRQFVESCLDVWPTRIRDLPLAGRHPERLMARMCTTRLAGEVRQSL
jgi:hypothetical protein